MVGASPLNQAITVPLLPGILAVMTIIVAGIGYFTTPLRRLAASALLNYTLLLATLISLVTLTHGTGSAFLSFFVLVLPFGVFFGLAGLIVSTGGLAGFLVQQYLSGTVDPGQLIALAILGGVPILAGVIAWSRDTVSSGETKEDRSYHELASELSQVAGKSEVVINAIGDGVLALDGQGVIQLINPAAQQMLGWGKHDSVNLSYKSVLKIINSKNQDVDEANDPVAHALTTNVSVKNDSFSLQTHAGKNFLAAISVNPVGQLGNGVIVVFRDITSEKSDERQRAEFISTASHEMRTPVASIEGYLGLALNPATAVIDDKARDFITKAHESAQHLGRLFADLLDVSKADDSRLKNDPKVLDVVPFVHDIVEGLAPKAVEKGLRIIYKPMPDGAQVVAEPFRHLNPVFYANVDNDHFREITQNLVENAIKYTLKGEVVIDVTGDNEHIVVSVTDSGIGIPKEDQTHLFQKFYRVDNSDTREIGGTGLGLYLCRRLAETIGGRIWVESEYKRGSTFFVEIPRIDNDEAQHLIEQASIEAERQGELDQEPAHREVEQEQRFATTAQPLAPPIPAPVIEPMPVPVAEAAPIPSPLPPALAPQPIVDTPPVPAPPPHPSTNVPLSIIEANPRLYVPDRQANTINVPPRQQ